MMNNIYYYAFYLLANLARRIKKSDKDFAFTGLMLLSTPMFLNALSIITLLGGIAYQEKKSTLNILSFLVVLSIVAINYFFLLRGKKSGLILAFFEEKCKTKHNLWQIIAVVAYFIFSIVSFIYVAKLNRGEL
jgi:hypothetical protein